MPKFPGNQISEFPIFSKHVRLYLTVKVVATATLLQWLQGD